MAEAEAGREGCVDAKMIALHRSKLSLRIALDSADCYVGRDILLCVQYSSRYGQLQFNPTYGEKNGAKEQKGCAGELVTRHSPIPALVLSSSLKDEILQYQQSHSNVGVS